ncbi:hypothetical protein B0H14DRAFT_3470033 [Mycena olivaceomarginata]|nr:hypothetical protein B0H14DRAFT_3470033 [Mycena olivaceomarginata]
MPRTHVSATGTHAICNPGKAVQQVRCRPTASGAAKATAALQKEEASAAHHRDQEITRISKEFGKTDSYYDRALKARAAGEQKSLDDYHNNLQDEMDDGTVLYEESLGKVEYERLMDQLEEKHQTETRGAHAMNKAAANDARKTSMLIGKQLTNLYERTGTLGLTELLSHVQEERREESQHLMFPSEMILKNTKVVMEYNKYDVVICAGLSMKMACWPKDVAVERVGSMNVETVQCILCMILWREIRWVQMSKEAGAVFIKEQDTQCAESGGTLLKHKERSDKGMVRGLRAKQTQKTPRDTVPTLAVVGAGSGLPVPIPSLSHSPSVHDHDVPHISSNTNTPPAPSTAAATTAASNTAAASTPDLNLTDLLSMPDGALIPDLDFNLDFLKISNDMAQPLPRPTPSPTKSALTLLDVNTGSKRTAAHLEDVNSGALAKKQHKKRSDAGIARSPRK